MSSQPTEPETVSGKEAQVREKLLGRRLPASELPTADHYTLEVNVYWRDDFFATTSAGRKRRIVVDGYKPFWKADLHVELPRTLARFTLARIEGRRARITIPEGASFGLKRDDGEVQTDLVLAPCRAPFPARSYEIGFFERLVVQVPPLTFVAQFVRYDGAPRRRWDWMVPRFLYPLLDQLLR